PTAMEMVLQARATTSTSRRSSALTRPARCSSIRKRVRVMWGCDIAAPLCEDRRVLSPKSARGRHDRGPEAGRAAGRMGPAATGDLLEDRPAQHDQTHRDDARGPGQELGEAERAAGDAAETERAGGQADHGENQGPLEHGFDSGAGNTGSTWRRWRAAAVN